jgi:hypothetical protein
MAKLIYTTVAMMVKIYGSDFKKAVFRIRIRIRIRVFFGHPDPLVRVMDPDPALHSNPDPSIIMQK